ncbi:MAG: ribosome maturation factor RimP [Bryobacteraceae bacterium]
MPETPQTTMLERITAIAERAARREGLEVWDVEVAGAGRGRIVRIYLDKPGGVTLDDCELISQQVSTVLDVEDVVPDQHYSLEVSSPGVERRLFKPEHFARFKGEKVRLALREPMENRRRWEGTVRGVEDGVILVETDGGVPLCLRMEQIEKAHLKFEW